MRDKLTIKQEKFVQGLFTGLSQREAFKQAFNADRMKDKTVDERACVLAGQDKIKTRIQDLTDELKARNMVTVEKVLAELAKIGFANGSDFAKVVEHKYMDPVYDEAGKKIREVEKRFKTVEITATSDLDKDKLPAIAGIKTTRDGIEIKTNDKVKALELMGRHLGMFNDKLDINAAMVIINGEDKLED